MNANGRKFKKIKDVFICVHLRSSVEEMILIL